MITVSEAREMTRLGSPDISEDQAMRIVKTVVTGAAGAGRSVREKLRALSPRAQQWLEKTCECLDEGVEYQNHSPSRTECRLAGVITQKPFGRVEISAEVMQLVWRDLCFRASH